MKTLKKKVKEICNKLTNPIYTQIKQQAIKHPRRSGIIMLVVIVFFVACSISRVIYMHSDNYVTVSKDKKPYDVDTVVKSVEYHIDNMDFNLVEIYEIIKMDRQVKKMLKDSILVKDTAQWIEINNKLDNIIKK